MFCVEFCIKQWYMAGRRGRRPLHILGVLCKIAVSDGIFPSLSGRGQGEGEKSFKFYKKCFV